MRNWGNINQNEHPAAGANDAMPYPSHKLTALLPGEEAAWNAIEGLRARGVPGAQIELYYGPSGAARLEAGRGSLIARVLHKLGPEGEQIDTHLDAVRAGEYLLAVGPLDNDGKRLAHRLVAAQGAHHMYYSGRFTIEELY